MAQLPPEPPAPTRPQPLGSDRFMVWTFCVLTGMSLLWCGVASWMLLRSLSAPDPGEAGYGAVDPHGYVALISGGMLVIGLPMFAACALAWRWSGRRLGDSRRPPG